MLFAILLLGIGLLVVLNVWAKLNAFPFPFSSVLEIHRFCQWHGGGSLLPRRARPGWGHTYPLLVPWSSSVTMIGKLVAEYGAAQRIVTALTGWFGRSRLMWALVITAFIVGIPLYYGIGFVLMVPLIIAISGKYDIPAVYIGLPMLTSLSVTHGFLPPHPSPTALVQQYHADMGLTLFYGLIVSVPCVLLAGPLFASALKGYDRKPLATFAARPVPDGDLPGTLESFMTALLPVALIGASAVAKLAWGTASGLAKALAIPGDPTVALMLALGFAVYALVLRKGRPLGACMACMADAARDVSPILLVIAGSGALKEILTESGTAAAVAGEIRSLHLHPLLAAWSIAAAVRVSLGSATVAGLTAAGLIAPLIAGTGISPALFVLPTGAGSLMFSHVNDSGFWLFKEYFNLSVKETLMTWSVMESIVSVVGLAAVMLIYLLTRG